MFDGFYAFCREMFRTDMPADGGCTTKTAGRLEGTSSMKPVTAQNRSVDLLDALTAVWERSVRATHWFLSASEIDAIRKDVPKALQTVEHLILAMDESGEPIGFMGIAGKKLEMLFLAPEERGKGLGKKLIRYGIETFGIRTVTVNEQNPDAVSFYKKMGFSVYKRTEIDEEGRPYPLLWMKRD